MISAVPALPPGFSADEFFHQHFTELVYKLGEVPMMEAFKSIIWHTTKNPTYGKELLHGSGCYYFPLKATANAPAMCAMYIRTRDGIVLRSISEEPAVTTSD